MSLDFFHENHTRSTQKKNHTVVDKAFKCDGCPKSFLSKSNLISYKQTNSCKRVSNYLPKGVTFQCYICSYVPTKFARLKCHMISHIGGRRFTMSHLAEHQRTHSAERPHIWSICSKAFNNNKKYYLILHSLVYSGVKPFACNESPKTFSNLSNIKRNQKSHKGERIFGCSECSKKFVH